MIPNFMSKYLDNMSNLQITTLVGLAVLPPSAYCVYKVYKKRQLHSIYIPEPKFYDKDQFRNKLRERIKMASRQYVIEINKYLSLGDTEFFIPIQYEDKKLMKHIIPFLTQHLLKDGYKNTITTDHCNETFKVNIYSEPTYLLPEFSTSSSPFIDQWKQEPNQDMNESTTSMDPYPSKVYPSKTVEIEYTHPEQHTFSSVF